MEEERGGPSARVPAMSRVTVKAVLSDHIRQMMANGEVEVPVPGEDVLFEARLADEKVEVAEAPIADDFVAESLKVCLSYWKDVLDADKEVLRWLEVGYELPFVRKRGGRGPQLSNHKMTAEQEAFISSTIDKMLRQKSVSRRTKAPKYVLPLGVVPKGLSYRMVHDARLLNSSLADKPFRMDCLNEVPEVVGPGWYMFSLDQEQGYYHVGLHQDSKKCMGFEWKGKFYVYNVISFGLKPSAYVFTKVVLQVVAFLREQGHTILSYIDDALLAAESYEEACALRDLVLDIMTQAGFRINYEKSVLEPCTRIEWLGTIIDSVERTFTITEKRLAKLRQAMGTVILRGTASPRERASIAGAMQSMVLAISPARALTAALYRSFGASGRPWDQRFPLGEDVTEDLKWWLANITKYNGRSRWKLAGAVTLETDSSGFGWGGTFDPERYNAVARGFWSGEDKKRSINWKELTAIEKCLLALPRSLVEGQRILAKVDNMAAVWYVRKGGGRVDDLAVIARRLWALCLELDIDLDVVHIPGKDNTRADFWSRLEDTGDWRLSAKAFDMVETAYGPHTVDRFATSVNTQLPRFNSRFWDVGSEGVDAFSLCWRGENNFANPDFRDFGRTIALIKEQAAQATIIAPVWPSRSWYAALLAITVSSIELPCGDRDLFVPGRSGSDQVVDRPGWGVRAFRVDGALAHAQ